MMKLISRASIIFSLRTFAAAMLALYLSYRLDLARPTWAFITAYIVSAPLLGMGRSKGVYRICGTIVGAVFSVVALPNLIDAPELLVLALALWIGGCLYLSIIDGTPKAYAFMLSGYTTALIGFPSVGAPQAIFDTALSRTEEIGLAILCVQLMGYLPFNQRAGDALQTRINSWMLDARQWSIDLLSASRSDVLIADRSKLMIDAVALDALRIHARYDTPYFADIEDWVIRLQRHIHDFFADLVTLEAQITMLKKTDRPSLNKLQPILDALLAWIEDGKTEVSPNLWNLLKGAVNDVSMYPLIKSGALDTISDLMVRRSESLDLRAKIVGRVKSSEHHLPLAHHVDHRQSLLYGLTVAGMVIAMSGFWILTGWPEGGIAVMIATVICCFFSSLEAPPKAAFLFLVMSIVGSFIGWAYNFIVFPHIDGFVLFAYMLAFTCIPIGIVMANPALTGIMLPVIVGINIASFENRFVADIAALCNGFVAQTIGVVAGGAALGFIRAASMHGANARLFNENGKALAALAADEPDADNRIIDRMSHRAGLVFVRAPALRDTREKVVRRILLDLQTGRALVQIKALLPMASPQRQQSLKAICARVAAHFLSRHGLLDAAPEVCDDIRRFARNLDENTHSYEAMRLIGLMKTLCRGLGGEVV